MESNFYVCYIHPSIFELLTQSLRRILSQKHKLGVHTGQDMQTPHIQRDLNPQPLEVWANKTAQVNYTGLPNA